MSGGKVIPAPWDDGVILHRKWFHVANLERSKLTEEELLGLIHSFRKLTKRGPTHIGMNAKHAGEYAELVWRQRGVSPYEDQRIAEEYHRQTVEHPEEGGLHVSAKGVLAEIQVVRMLPDRLILIARRTR